MSLLKPTPGEAVDRVTILALKILHGKAGNVPVAHFVEEETELWAWLQERGNWLVEDLDPPYDESFSKWRAKCEELIKTLAAVNGILWSLEDLVRSTPATDLTELGKVCISIAQSNDVRSKLIREINEHYHVETHQEKLYSRKLKMVSDIELGMAG